MPVTLRRYTIDEVDEFTYLAVGVREVWRVELETRRVFRRPVDDGEQEAGGELMWRSPASGRELVIRVADLFEGLPT